MGQLQDAFRDAAGEVANIKAKPSNRYWWLYGTIMAKNDNGTLDVAIDGVTIQQVKATVSCMMANVGDRVIVLKAGPLMTCVDVIATSDNVKVQASSIIGTLPVANGGTGASSAAEALTAIGAASATELSALKKSVSQVIQFATTAVGRKLTLAFKSANHATALVLIDNNGSVSLMLVNCYNKSKKTLGGIDLSVAFPTSTSATISSVNWSEAVVITPSGCTITTS